MRGLRRKRERERERGGGGGGENILRTLTALTSDVRRM